MLLEVAETIMNKYRSSIGLKSALTGGLHFQQAPQGVSGSYGVFSIVGYTQEEISTGKNDNIKTVDLQFDIFSSKGDGGSEALEISEFLTDCYDWEDLIVAEHYTLKMQPIGMTNLMFVDEVWQITMTYELGILKE